MKKSEANTGEMKVECKKHRQELPAPESAKNIGKKPKAKMRYAG